MNRRDFLQFSSLVPLAGLLSMGNALAGQSRRIVVLIELKGGNDGLNTLIPVEDDHYHRARPGIALDKGLPLEQGMALNPYLKPLLPLWNEGQMAWVQGVGYAKPSRSHFHSIDIWETGSTRHDETQGWLNRVFAAQSGAINGIVLGDNNLGPMGGPEGAAVAMEDPQTFLRQTKYLNKQSYSSHNPSLAHLQSVQKRILTAAEQLRSTYHGRKARVEFPNSRFGRKLEQVTRMISNGMNVPVYKVSLEGFDTHAAQTDQHNNLMHHLGGGLWAFSRAMKAAGLWDSVLVMSYSEFGRRVAENHSEGTDHGSAAAHFVLGGRVRGGLYGRQPSLDPSSLLDGDMQHNIDFRQMYATLAQRWWQRPSPWRSYNAIPFV